MITIRQAELSDAERLAEIYADYVKNTAISFEYTAPSPDEFRNRMKKTMAKYPYLVILQDGRIEGYAYAGAFIGRAAFDWSCELSVYLDHEHRRQGLGRRLYEALEGELRKMGILNLYASISYPVTEDEYLTKNSAEFHVHLGFVQTAEFHQCGYKFGRWYNSIWMEKFIGEHSGPRAPIIPYPELCGNSKEVLSAEAGES